MNALVAGEAKRYLASRGFVLTRARQRCACTCPENAGGKQLRDFLTRGSAKLTGIAAGGFGVMFEM